jgi:23S rRNA (uracil1939-C5)-methyltransferase
LNIAQVKQECGIIERENYNKPSNEYNQPNCPKANSDAIKDAFEHFKMI